jgi:hypothetical protein
LEVQRQVKKLKCHSKPILVPAYFKGITAFALLSDLASTVLHDF